MAQPPEKPHLVQAAQQAAEAAVPDQLRELRVLQQRSEHLAAELRLEKVRREAAEAELAGLAEWRKLLEDAASRQPAMELKPLPRRRGEGRSNSTPIICCTDWHIEQRIDPATINGLNEFDLTIAKARVDRLWRKACYMIDFWRAVANVRDAVVWLGGDLISGSIHAELEEINQLGPVDAIALVADLVGEGIQYLLDHAGIERVHVVCSLGNHGRTTEKKRRATAYQHSYEALAYQLIAQRWGADDRVAVQIARSYHAYLRLHHQWDVRFHHGDEIRYQGGVGSIAIPVNKAIAAWNKSRRVHLDIFGHWHQFMDTWNWVACGSLVGYDAYAVAIKADYQDPTQTIVWVDSDHGKVAALPLFVGERAAPQPAGAGGWGE